MLEGLVVGDGRDRKEGHKGKESRAGGTEPWRGTGGNRGRMGKRTLMELGGGVRGRGD